MSNLMRRFNKSILDPFALWVAAHRKMYYGVLHHTGRRSGASYRTPVVAKVTDKGIIIPLPYWREHRLVSQRPGRWDVHAHAERQRICP